MLIDQRRIMYTMVYSYWTKRTHFSLQKKWIKSEKQSVSTEVWSSCHLLGCQLFLLWTRTPVLVLQNRIEWLWLFVHSSCSLSSPLASLSNSPLAAVRLPSNAAISRSKHGKKKHPAQHSHDGVLLCVCFFSCTCLRWLDTFRTGRMLWLTHQFMINCLN